MSESFTTTVYQFGISEETEGVVGFAYRSTNNFMLEEIGYGTVVKPECDVLEGDLIESLPKMMNNNDLFKTLLQKTNAFTLVVRLLHIT